MAKAKITCKCEICGGTFEHVRTCANSSAAASYEEWAAEHVTVCPSCYAAAKKAEAKAKLDAYIAARTSKITIVDVVKKLELIVTESNASKLIDALG